MRGAPLKDTAGTPSRSKNGDVRPLSCVLILAEFSNPSEAEVGAPRSNGCAKKKPAPPRMTVLCRPKGRQAKPNRGPKLFQSVAYGRDGHPSCPTNLTTPGVPETGLIAVGSKLFMRLSRSVIGVSVSQRIPRLIVKDWLIVQSSWKNPARYQL